MKCDNLGRASTAAITSPLNFRATMPPPRYNYYQLCIESRHSESRRIRKRTRYCPVPRRSSCPVPPRRFAGGLQIYELMSRISATPLVDFVECSFQPHSEFKCSLKRKQITAIEWCRSYISGDRSASRGRCWTPTSANELDHFGGTMRMN